MKINWIMLFLIGLCVSTFFVTTLLVTNYFKKSEQSRNTALAQAQDITKKTAQQVDRLIAMLTSVTHNVTTFFSGRILDANLVEQELNKKPIFITGLGIVVYNDSGNLLSGSYTVEKNGKQQFVSLTDAASQNIKSDDFFARLKQHQSTCIGPVVDPYTGKKVIMYAEPIVSDTKQQTFVFATLSLDHIQHVLNTLYLGKNGYFFLLDTASTIIVHPRNIFTLYTTTLQDIAGITKSPELIKDISSKTGTLTYHNEATGKESWLVHKTVDPLGWTLCGVFEKATGHMPENQERHQLMLISLMILVSCLLLLSIFIGVLSFARIHQWILSFLVSCACIVCIGSLWYIAKVYPSFDEDAAHDIVPIENKLALYTFLDSLQTKQPYQKETISEMKESDYYLSYRYKKGRYIPTGMFIHYMQFVSESQVQIVGYVWQRYFDGTHDGIIRGFILPQATSDASITEVFHTKVERQETIVWRVNATLNQKFSYARYPFDTREISIQLWHADFSKNIILVPDFDSYPLLTTTSLPGLSSNAYLPNWKFDSSYFGYQKYLYNAMFGLYTYGPFGIYETSDKSYTPELHFVAKTQRLLLDTLIDDLLPLFLIALLLFVIFITDIGHGYEVFGAYASIFFGIVVSQLHFRSKIPSNQLVYFENIYVIMYLALVITVMLTVVKLRSVDEHSLTFKKVKITELFYWPLLLGSLIALTFIYLY